MKTKSFFIGLVVFLGFATSAQATLLDGKTVKYQYLYPNSSSVYNGGTNGNYLVGPGTEISDIFCCGYASLDISDANLFVAFRNSATFSATSFNGFQISDVFNMIDDFTSVTINGATNMGGLDSSRITFDANNIYVNWQGLSFNPDTTVSIDVNGGMTSVPEPGTIALLGMGLMGLAFLRRRKSF